MSSDVTVGSVLSMLPAQPGGKVTITDTAAETRTLETYPLDEIDRLNGEGR